MGTAIGTAKAESDPVELPIEKAYVQFSDGASLKFTSLHAAYESSIWLPYEFYLKI